MSETNIVEVARESCLGHHMVNTFQNCPRRWYIKYICSILPSKLGKALIFGKAWHEGMEVFYKGSQASADEAYLKIKASLEDNKTQFKKPEDFAEMLAKVPILFNKWYNEIGCKLHDEFAIISVEEELKPKLGGAFTMTIRPDAIVKERSSGKICIPEHKTTSYSINSQFDTVIRGDQATAYCWGVLKVHPEMTLNFMGVLLDVCYNRASVVDVKQMQILRNKQHLAEFELSLLGVFLDLANRIRGLDVHPEMLPMLFPRNGAACASFGCEYEDICRNRITPGMVLGSDYIVDPWKGKEQLLADTENEKLIFKTFSDKESLDGIELQE